MTNQLRVDVKNKSKNSFANSFVFSNDDFMNSNDNQFAGVKLQEREKTKEEGKQKKQTKQKKVQSKVKHQDKIDQQEEQQLNANKIDEKENNSHKKNKKNKKRNMFEAQQLTQTFYKQDQTEQPSKVIKGTKQNHKETIKDSNIKQKQGINTKQRQGINKAQQKNGSKLIQEPPKIKPDIKIKEPKQEIFKPTEKKDKEKLTQQKINSKQTQQHSQKVNQPNKRSQKQSPVKQSQKQVKQKKVEQQSPSKPLKSKQQIHQKTSQQIENTPKKSKDKTFPVYQNPQTDRQKTKIIKLNENIDKISTSIKDIKQNYKQIDRLDQDQILFKRKNRTKELEIRDFLERKRQEKEKRQKLIQEIKEREQKLIAKSIEEKEQKAKREKEQKIKKIKELDYVKPKQKYNKYKQIEEKGNTIASSVISRYKSHQPTHIKYQRNFQLQQSKRKQQQLQLLEQRKQRYQSLDLEQLEEFKRFYEERKEELDSMRKDQREEQWNKIQEDNALMRDQIWKGPSHDIVDQELIQKKRKKNQPKQKSKKIKQYYQYIKQNFLPKTHQPKRSPIHDQHISESLGNYAGRYHGPADDQLASYDPNKRHVKKYKYFQGKAMGEVVETIPVIRSYSQQKKIGEGYLEYLKALPKKKQQSESTTEIDENDLEMIHKKFNSISKVKRQALPFYENQTQKRTIELSAKPTKEQVKIVYEQLKNQDIKLKSKRDLLKVMKSNQSGAMEMEKHVNNSLVLNMERKLDLLAKLG